MLLGPDVSAYQPDVDFGAIRRQGHAFVFIKASEGQGYENSHFVSHMQAARAAGLFAGGYHFTDASDAVGQARYFASVLRKAGGVRPGDLPPALDVEAGVTSPGWVGSWVSEMRRETARVPVIYGGAWWRDNIGGNNNFGCPLWLAAYVGDPKPYVPSAWGNWTFWQYTDSASVAGIPGGSDLSKFVGTPAQLQALCRGNVLPPVLGRRGARGVEVFSGPWIISYTRGLIFLGYLSGQPRDFFTWGVQGATKKFQRNHRRFGLSDTGVVDAKTLAVFRSAVEWRKKNPH